MFAPTGETTQATVVRVIDGDTIIVTIGDTDYRVRYIGIDAPESVSLDKPVEFMGREAADANRRLVSSANVILERDVSETDQHGQLLRNVWVDRDGTLVLAGARAGPRGLCPDQHVHAGRALPHPAAEAQQEARVAAIGMWGDHPAPVTAAVRPAPIETALPRLVGTEPVAVFGSSPTVLDGQVGIYTWPAISFADPSLRVRWDVRAPVTKPCEVT